MVHRLPRPAVCVAGYVAQCGDIIRFRPETARAMRCNACVYTSKPGSQFVRNGRQPDATNSFKAPTRITGLPTATLCGERRHRHRHRHGHDELHAIDRKHSTDAGGHDDRLERCREHRWQPEVRQLQRHGGATDRDASHESERRAGLLVNAPRSSLTGSSLTGSSLTAAGRSARCALSRRADFSLEASSRA